MRAFFSGGLYFIGERLALDRRATSSLFMYFPLDFTCCVSLFLISKPSFTAGAPLVLRCWLRCFLPSSWLYLVCRNSPLIIYYRFSPDLKPWLLLFEYVKKINPRLWESDFFFSSKWLQPTFSISSPNLITTLKEMNLGNLNWVPLCPWNTFPQLAYQNWNLLSFEFLLQSLQTTI